MIEGNNYSQKHGSLPLAQKNIKKSSINIFIHSCSRQLKEIVSSLYQYVFCSTDWSSMCPQQFLNIMLLGTASHKS